VGSPAGACCGADTAGVVFLVVAGAGFESKKSAGSPLWMLLAGSSSLFSSIFGFFCAGAAAAAAAD